MSTALAYGFICMASVMFGTQFIFQQRYSKKEGTTVNGAMRFSFFVSLFQIPFLFILPADEPISFTLPAAAICLVSSVNSILNAYFCVKVFERADMTLFSIFEMLGGMTLPFIGGMLFFGEPPTAPKFIGFALIALSLFLETGKFSRIDKRSLFYYFSLFITNGLSGVFAKWNQTLENGVSGNSFIMISSIWTLIICGVCLLVQKFAMKKSIGFTSPKNAFISIIPYVVIATLGSVFLLTALEVLPASVQYPMSTGGTIVVSVIISTIRREKLKVQNYIAAVIAVISAVVIAL